MIGFFEDDVDDADDDDDVCDVADDDDEALAAVGEVRWGMGCAIQNENPLCRGMVGKI